MITIGSTANPFLRAADDLGFGPNHLFAVELDANLAGIDEWLGISPPSYVATNVPSFIQQLPEAQENNMVADILVAMWTGDKQDLACTGHPREDPLHKWCNQVQTAIQAASEGLRLRSAIVVVPAIQAKPPAAISDLLNHLPQGWNGTVALLNNTEHGGRAATAHWVAVLGTKEFVSLWTPPPIEHHNTQDMQDVLDSNTANGTATLILSQFDVRPDRNPTPRPSDPKVAVWIRERGEHQWWPVYDPAHPAPVVTGDGDNEFGSSSFGFLSHTPLMQPCVREASQTEVLRTLGFDDLDTKAVRHAAAGALDERIPSLPGVQGARSFLLSIQQALAVAPAPTTAPIMVLTGVPRESWPQANRLDANPIAAMGPALNRWTTIPLPTEHSWQEACKADPDMRRIRDHLTGHYLLERDRLNNPAYWEPLQQGRLALDGDTLYHYEQPTHARVRQLRTRIVPRSLRRLVFTACHSSPLSGHTGVMKTFWRVAVRFWWPGMSYQIRQWVLQCGHCRLANSSSQLSSAWLHGYDSKSPFDIQFLDVWTPGCLPSKQGHIKLLCSMDELCGFVEGAPIAKEDSITIAREAFSRIFIPNGLPRLVIVDDGSPFKGALRAMCKLLSIPCEPVSPQNHRAVRVERFFRYLNKVERIVVANNQSFHTWLQGVYFSLYAWNSSPIDGTNIIRSFVAKGRTFPLPIDLALDSTRPGPAYEGAPALEHVATMSAVLERQRDVLRLINDERRRRHRELRNASANQKTFQPGDIVIVRRQIQSDATEGKVAKLMFKATGPYIVLKQISPASYSVRKLPFVEGAGRKGKPRKVNAALMQTLPSTLCIHKQVDGAGTRFAALDGPTVLNPLEPTLGAYEYGSYEQHVPDDTPERQPFAFDKLQDMWTEEVQSSDSDDYDPDSDDDKDANDDGKPQADAPGEPTKRTPRPRKRPNRWGQKSDTTHSRPPHRTRTALLASIQQSKDRLCLISHTPTGATAPAWYMVQVDMDETDLALARSRGIYHVRWWLPHHMDQKKRPVANCRFWPEIHELTKQNAVGPLRPIRPHKVESAIANDENLMWYQMPIKLHDTLIAGPFDFATTLHNGQAERHRVPEPIWEQLKRAADDHHITVDVHSQPDTTPRTKAAVATIAAAALPPGVVELTSDPATPWASALKQKAHLAESTTTGRRITPQRKIYRPPLTSKYVDPDYVPDTADPVDSIFKDYGDSLWRDTRELPPRDPGDIIQFTPTDEQELQKNLVWEGCPEQHRPAILTIIRRWWDVFTEKGLRKPIRGFEFRVDTGDSTPVCCKVPRYGHFEAEIIRRLCRKLKENDMIEHDDGPWGALIVLAAKPGQEHTPWWDFIWRLCVSFRQLNRVTRPFRFPFRRCDDAVLHIGRGRYRISIDMDSGYWQVAVEKRSRPKLAFFGVEEKLRWTKMPMGALNAAPCFAAMMSVLREMWQGRADKRNIPDTGSEVIMDDIMLFALTLPALLDYFEVVLEVLQHFCATLKLKKCRFLGERQEFVGVDVLSDGNAPAEAKHEAFHAVQRPNTYTDLRMLIGMFGFYALWIPMFELRIIPWRRVLKAAPTPGETPEGNQTPIGDLWTDEHDTILSTLKNDVITGPVLARPDYTRRFYLKTDWSSAGMGAVLLQSDDNEQANQAETAEDQGGPCTFDLLVTGKRLRLRPVAFLSRKCSEREQSYHSYIGEAATGVWAVEKFRPFLYGREFTWITDCSGLRQFFEGEDLPAHVVQRWRLQLLRYNFTIVHRPSRLMAEVDLLSRYNAMADDFRAND